MGVDEPVLHIPGTLHGYADMMIVRAVHLLTPPTTVGNTMFCDAWSVSFGVYSVP